MVAIIEVTNGTCGMQRIRGNWGNWTMASSKGGSFK
jgi:hypothetical protein